MLPPVEDAVLQSNPDFAKLYSTLTTVILNPDGSTKNDPAAKERSRVREELRKHRIEAAKRHLLIHAISTAVPPETKPNPRRAKSAQPRPENSSSELPPALLDLLLLLPPLLRETRPLPADSVHLLLTSPPLSELPTLLPQLTPLVSDSLRTSAVNLARVANPSTNPSFLHRALATLPAQITTLGARITEQQRDLTRARAATATSLLRLLSMRAQALALLIRALEAKHGVVARALEGRAAEVALVAQRQEIEAQMGLWNLTRETYTPEAAEALANYATHLRDARVRLGETIRNLRGELAAYGVGEHAQEKDGKGRTMREMARVKRDMERQMEEITGDLERLRRA